MPYALALDANLPILNVYTNDYGFKSSDVGIYSQSNNSVSAAAWIRLYKESDGVSGYVDDVTPVLVIGVIPDVRGMGIGSLVMDQLLQEAAVVYDQISVQSTSCAIKFYERLGFVRLIDSESKNIFTMVKKLEKKALTRPTDGYDPRRWMD
ncbi:MAG: GNAT family N-acetyltransferase [Sulfuricurvum sp.]|nr:GNAT family N-acetyltransferase [Sulfuricurvum sp.]